ncbi:hypothetical protein HDU82_006847 [Entophlyctis luteolus]|nr:hypothetical protein HDU82_006847 [Entophlyctis luteolus]
MSCSLFFDGSSCVSPAQSACDDEAVHLSPGRTSIVVVSTKSPTLRVSVTNVPLRLKPIAAELLTFSTRWSIPQEWFGNKESFARWPTPKNFCGGSQKLTSLDSRISLQLSFHRKSFYVSMQGHSQICTLSTLDAPNFLVYPLALLLGSLSQNQLIDLARASGAIITSRHVAIAYPLSMLVEMDRLFEPLKNCPIRVLQTPSVVYRTVCIRRDSLLPVRLESIDSGALRFPLVMIEASFLEDNTLLQSDTDFAFVTMHTDCASEEKSEDTIQMFDVRNLPEKAVDYATKNSYSLKVVVENMKRLYQQAFEAFVVRTNAEPVDSNLGCIWLPHTSPIKQSVSIPLVGKFISFADYSLRGEFENSGVCISVANSKLLDLQTPSRKFEDSYALVTCADGQKFKIRITKPIGFEREVDFLIQFARWLEKSGNGYESRCSERLNREGLVLMAEEALAKAKLFISKN